MTMEAKSGGGGRAPYAGDCRRHAAGAHVAGCRYSVAQEAQKLRRDSGAVLDVVTVTGTRIVRDGYEAPTPMSVLGTEQLNENGDHQSGRLGEPLAVALWRPRLAQLFRQRQLRHRRHQHVEPAWPGRQPHPHCCWTASAWFQRRWARATPRPARPT